MDTETEKSRIDNLIVDIEDQLRHYSRNNTTGVVFSKLPTTPPFDKKFQEMLHQLEKSSNETLQKQIGDLLEKRGPKRNTGKVDTACFYDSCCISPTTWSNFQYGKFSKVTVLKILTGLKCNFEETESLLKLAGIYLTNSRSDQLYQAAILSGHNNTSDMYDILEYYSKQYPKEVKNYYKNES